MKSIILIPQLPTNLEMIKGGTHSALINLLSGLAKKKIQVRVISFSKEVNQTTIIEYSNNINIFYEKEGSLPFHSLNYFFNGPGILKKHMDSFQPDVIHFQTGNSFFFVKRKLKNEKNILLTIHGMSLEEAKRKIKITDKLKWYFNGIINEWTICKNIIHLSHFSKNRNRKSDYKHETIIHNAIDANFFEIPTKKSFTNKLLYVGVIDNNKNLLFLLKSLKTLLNQGVHYQLDVLGGFNTEEYKKIIHDYIQINKLEPYVNFKGWANRKQVIDSITENDILVVSSFHESLPMAIAEVMASARLVVSSNVGGISEMFTDKKSGFLFNLNNPELLPSLLKEISQNPLIFEKMALNARNEAFLKFHADTIAQQTIDFYTTITSNI